MVNFLDRWFGLPRAHTSRTCARLALRFEFPTTSYLLVGPSFPCLSYPVTQITSRKAMARRASAGGPAAYMCAQRPPDPRFPRCLKLFWPLIWISPGRRRVSHARTHRGQPCHDAHLGEPGSLSFFADFTNQTL
jgi:hypothetical protein